ncbi:MAG: hypothetical protein IKM50_02380 [Tidjanibacter sp.]|nr:hypothetical protein [Tidjanibacter sp.]
MKIFKHTVALLVTALLAVSSASAQFAAGELIGVSDFQTTDMLSTSRSANSYTSARVAGMAGAFTSLGGDIASISINPAGLGMFRRGVLSFSPSLSFTNQSNSANPYGTDAPARFSMGNLGFVTNVYEGAGSVVSVNLGFSYNKIADFNYEKRYSMNGKYSIADLFAEQMSGIPSSWLNSSAAPFENYDIFLNEWGGVLAYQTLLIDPVVADDPANKAYHVTAIDANAGIGQYMSMKSRGSIGEYNFAAGMNIANSLYLGATVTIQDIYNDRDYIYDEEYDNGENSKSPNYLAAMSYNPHVREIGTGMNLRLGAIWRPFGGLRLGVAFQTPTLVSLQKEYYSLMGTRFQDERNFTYKSSVHNIYTYDYSTPAKLSLGASYTLGSVAAVSFDYDKVWYKGMRMYDDSRELNDYMKNNIRTQYQTADNVRVGLELRPISWLAMRAGYAYYGSPAAVGDNIFDAPIELDSRDLAFGLGFKVGNTSIDAAFVNKQTNYSDYDLFYWDGGEGNIIANDLVSKNKARKNIATLTVTVPF